VVRGGRRRMNEERRMKSEERERQGEERDTAGEADRAEVTLCIDSTVVQLTALGDTVPL
jgi:hypothetical protein